jgi:hypothetical protein
MPPPHPGRINKQSKHHYKADFGRPRAARPDNIALAVRFFDQVRSEKEGFLFARIPFIHFRKKADLCAQSKAEEEKEE